jgi:predicted ATPase
MATSQGRPQVVLTGGPGGGKTTLIEELTRDPAWAGRFLALPEAIHSAGRVGISPHEPLFQRLMVETQRGLEEALARTLEPDDPRFVLCHRGTLDPLAYWLDRGWDEAAFFAYTRTTREQHYRRYKSVIHLVTAADGAKAHYQRWPDAHRPETIEQAVRLDRLLAQAWGGHPCYHRLNNEGQNWAAKAAAAKEILAGLLA